MKESKESKEVKVVPEVPSVDIGMELYGKLRNEINQNKEDFRRQVYNIKDAIETKTQELELLNTKKLKLEGAIEAADIFLKAVLPSNDLSK